MKALTKILAGGGVALAALASAAPASAQYYPDPYGNSAPGYGYGYGTPGYGYGNPYGGGGIIGQVIGSVIGGNQGYNQPMDPYRRYGRAGQQAIGQCMGAVQQRLGGGYGYNGYPQQGAYGGGRVLGVSDVDPRSNGGFTVRGVANSGRNTAYGYGQYGRPQVDLIFRCKTDSAGYVVDVDLDQAMSAYGQAQPAYTPYGTDYSQYGYRRY
jgi:hypothetical protein